MTLVASGKATEFSISISVHKCQVTVGIWDSFPSLLLSNVNSAQNSNKNRS